MRRAILPISVILVSAFDSGCSSQVGAQADEAQAALSTDAGTQPSHPSIVLVHGAFADGTGWQHVIPLLERDGYTVIAVQNPLTSVEVTSRRPNALSTPNRSKVQWSWSAIRMVA